MIWIMLGRISESQVNNGDKFEKSLLNEAKGNISL
jgi:hypothetical protein